MTACRFARLVTVVALLAVPSAGDAQLAREGTFAGKFGWTSGGTPHEMEGRTFFVGSFSGPFFNDAGSGFLHHSAWVCPGTNDIVGGVVAAGGGYCTMTDADGDRVFSSWTAKGTEPGRVSGEFRFTGGTGKYRGITGSGTFESFFIGMTMQGYTTTRGSWRLQ